MFVDHCFVTMHLCWWKLLVFQ